MTEELKKILSEQKSKKFATEHGNEQHRKMQFIVIDKDIEQGDPDLIQKIKQNPELIRLFSANARTEIPVAGIINGTFVSRRLDRMIENNAEKSIIFMDYKTDTNKAALRDKYMAQMREYAQLLQDIYPGYSIRGLILWLHDFSIEQAC